MSLHFGDRVAFSTPTTGTGTLEVGSIIGGSYVLPEDVGFLSGLTTFLWLSDGNNFEICRATFAAGSPSHFSRDTVLISKSGGVVGTSKISLSGSAEVRVVSPASFIQALARSVNGNTPDADGNVYLNADDILSDSVSPPASVETILQYLLDRMPPGVIADQDYVQQTSRRVLSVSNDVNVNATLTLADSDSGKSCVWWRSTGSNTGTLQLPDGFNSGFIYNARNITSVPLAINLTAVGGAVLSWYTGASVLTGNRSLANGGVATIEFDGANFTISGTGLS